MRLGVKVMDKKTKIYSIIIAASYVLISLFSIASALISKRRFEWTLLLIILVYYIFIPLITVVGGIVCSIFFTKINHFVYCIILNFLLCFLTVFTIFYLGNLTRDVEVTAYLFYSFFMVGVMLVSIIASSIIRMLLLRK